MRPETDVPTHAAEPSAEERRGADPRIARAIDQACALRETLGDEEDLRSLVDVLILELGARVAWRKA